jgi:hypothetical protein
MPDWFGGVLLCKTPPAASGGLDKTASVPPKVSAVRGGFSPCRTRRVVLTEEVSLIFSIIGAAVTPGGVFIGIGVLRKLDTRGFTPQPTGKEASARGLSPRA